MVGRAPVRPEALLREARQLPRHVHRVAVRGPGGNEAVRQAHLVRLLRLHDPPGEDEVEGAGETDEFWQPKSLSRHFNYISFLILN